MGKKKICFVAQFPPPIHGLSKAVDTLYNSELIEKFDFEKVNITDNRCFLKNLILISKSKADLFYFTISQTKGGNLRDLVILKLLELRKKKCLIHLHGGYYRKLVDNDLNNWQRKANYKAISKLEGAIVLGRSLEYIFEGMLSKNKIYTVANCVDDEFLITQAEFGEKLASESDVKRILYLSNFIKTKGYPEVLELAKEEKKRCDKGGKKQLHFDFAGRFFEKDDEDFFFDYIKSNGLEPYVTYHGVVGGEQKRSLLKECDAFILLTRYPNEGQPISILEAMGNGLAVITTNHAGIPDVVKDVENGIVEDKENLSEIGVLYDKIAELFANRGQEVASNNRNAVLSCYTQKMYLKNMKDVFDKV